MLTVILCFPISCSFCLYDGLIKTRHSTLYCHMQWDGKLFSHSILAPDAVFLIWLLLKHQCRERTCPSLWACLALAPSTVPASYSRRLLELFRSTRTSFPCCASVFEWGTPCLRILELMVVIGSSHEAHELCVGSEGLPCQHGFHCFRVRPHAMPVYHSPRLLD